MVYLWYTFPRIKQPTGKERRNHRMTFRMRHPDPDAQFCAELRLEALEKAIPSAEIEAVLQAE